MTHYSIGLAIYLLGIALIPLSISLSVISYYRGWKDRTQKRLVYVFWSSFLVSMIGVFVLATSPELWS